jgi:hypothetical protein
MSKRMPFGINEQVEVRSEAMLACIPGLITNIIVRNVDEWAILIKDGRQMRIIRSLTLSYRVINRFTTITPRPSQLCDTFVKSMCDVELPPNIKTLILRANEN